MCRALCVCVCVCVRAHACICCMCVCVCVCISLMMMYFVESVGPSQCLGGMASALRVAGPGINTHFPRMSHASDLKIVTLCGFPARHMALYYSDQC